jgi:nucleoside-diphosphate-sugar epimerase
VGLARSDGAAAAIIATGAEVWRGSLDEPASIRDGAALCDGVVHLGYNHDFSQMQEAAKTDHNVIEAIGSALKGSDRPFVVAGGVLGLAPGRIATESDAPDPAVHPRTANVVLALALAQNGVRSSCVRFAPTVHGDGDHGFIATLVAVARAKGNSSYIGDGANCWPAVHRLDAARVYRLALERGAKGERYHAVAEEGVPFLEIAEVIGRRLNIPVVSKSPAEAAKHFGWFAMFAGIDAPASSARTRAELGWTPEQPGLIADVDHPAYFAS